MLEEGQVSPSGYLCIVYQDTKEEVADEVFSSDKSIVFEEAENRLYAAMAVIEALW